MLLAGCQKSPYHGQELRRAEAPVTIVGTYMAYACGDGFPQIEPIDDLPDNLDVSWLDGGLTFRVPARFRAPDQVAELGVAGNRFELAGYHHYVASEGRRYLHPQFDLYAWRPVIPYSVWSSQAATGDGPVPREDVTSYRDGSVGWRRFEAQPADAKAYDYARKYDPCP